MLLLILFGVLPAIVLAFSYKTRSLEPWQRWLVTALLLATIYYPLGKIITGPPIFYWQPPYMISNKIFFLLPPVVYFLTASIIQMSKRKRKVNSSAPKYQHSFTTSAELDQLQLQLERLIEQDRVYTQSDITLNRLAEMLHSDRHTVSRLINERYDKNFFHFINAYRIRDFVQQVTRVRNKDKTFLELAYAVGFSNKTSFIRAFKRENHQTPSQYFRGSET